MSTSVGINAPNLGQRIFLEREHLVAAERSMAEEHLRYRRAILAMLDQVLDTVDLEHVAHSLEIRLFRDAADKATAARAITARCARNILDDEMTMRLRLSSRAYDAAFARVKMEQDIRARWTPLLDQPGSAL